jgi:hypothetical protein
MSDLSDLKRSAEQRVRALEEQVERLTESQRKEIGDFLNARRPRPKPKRTLEERVAALEKAILGTPASEKNIGTVGIELCPKCHVTSLRVVTDHRCNLPDCANQHQYLRCAQCNYQESRTLKAQDSLEGIP